MYNFNVSSMRLYIIPVQIYFFGFIYLDVFSQHKDILDGNFLKIKYK